MTDFESGNYVETQALETNINLFNQRKQILEDKLSAQKIKLTETKTRVQKQIDDAKVRFNADPERLQEIIPKLRATELSAQRGVDKTTSILSFLRPRSDTDMEERSWAYDNFEKKMKENVPKSLPLRFHGTPIYYTEQAIKSGGLSSSEDRLGTSTSYDVAGQVSVSTPNNCNITIQGYTDLTAESGHLPAGCIFALLPRSEEEAKTGETSLLMGNVDFKTNKELLFGVITTEENKERVKTWMRESQLDGDLVSTFREFPEKMANLKDEVQKNPQLLTEIVPYKVSS